LDLSVSILIILFVRNLRERVGNGSSFLKWKEQTLTSMRAMNQPDRQRQFPDIEVEMPPSSEQKFSFGAYCSQWLMLRRQVQRWFEQLPTAGKAIALLAAVAVGFSLLKTVLQLVSAVMAIAFFGFLLYAAYKFLIAPHSSQS
jgi:hypothetical protein